jgi:hypothetical protein
MDHEPLKLMAAYFFETLGITYQGTHCHFSEDCNPGGHFIISHYYVYCCVVPNRFGEISVWYIKNCILARSLILICLIATAKRQKQAMTESDADLIERIKAQRREVQARNQSQHILSDLPYPNV